MLSIRSLFARYFCSARIAISGRFIKLQDKSRSEEDKVGTVADVSELSLRDEQTTRRAPTTIKLSRNAIPPFIASHDISRGLFVVFQTAITYALMLTVMYVPVNLRFPLQQN